MYPWNRAAEETTVNDSASTPATRAVQVALDRRDNGGDTGVPAAR
jgi:hypothetical protein